MSDICEEFGCLPRPGGAVDQDYQEMMAIREYRSARTFIDLFNKGREGLMALEKMPGTVALMKEILRAQADNDTLTDHDMFAYLRDVGLGGEGTDGDGGGDRSTTDDEGSG